MKLKLTLGFLTGIGISIALVFLITDMLNTYMNWYNFGTFIMIFTIGIVLLIGAFSVIQKFKKRPLNRVFFSKRMFHSLVIMNIGLIIFGFTFYDYSLPRDITYGDKYQNNYGMPSQLDDDWTISSLTKEGMDSIMYNGIINKLVNDKAFKRMHSLLIVKN